MSKNQIQQQKFAVHRHKFRLKALCSSILLTVVSSVSLAETKTLSLESAIEKVETYQQTQNIWATQTEIDQANLSKAKLWKNPELNIEQTGFDSNKEQEFSLSISQELDVFGVRKANQNLAVFAQEKMLLAQKIYTAQLRLTVKYLWSQLAIAELEKNIVQAQLNVSEANLNAIQKRFQAGSVAEVDLKRAQLSHTENIRLFKQADLQVQLAQQQLSNIWGASDKTIQIQLAVNRLWPQDSYQNVQTYLAENYFEKSRILQLKNTQAQLAYIQAAKRPNPTISLGMNRTKAPENGNENQIMLGVSVPLNIFDRQQYDVKINQHKQDALNRQQGFYAQQNALQVGTLLTQLQGLEAQFKDVEKTQLPLAIEVQQKTLLGFSAGKFALTDVQQATLQLQDIRQRKVELLKAAWQTAISAESLSLGIEPSVVMSADAIAQINQTLWDNIQTSPVVGEN
ncbi:RND transporter [Acinetobacter defluvii]|uniref:TolC family protein n=1 Tax=Acinetobacter defluvii TaxID=1871111 RepID=UPI0014903878|nr:TolC family protein [Acinetobacter defluvii]NNP72722.1 RND transporter [Acinetobacter defluvii]